MAAGLAACLMPMARAGSLETTTPAVINVNTLTAIPIPAGFSGFNVPQLRNGVEYYDPKFVAAVTPLTPGWMRFAAGTSTMAFDWNAGHMNTTWISELSSGSPPMVSSSTSHVLNSSQVLTQAKGGVYLSDFATFAQTFNSPAIICFNSFTDDNPGSASNEALAAQSAGLNVLEWELGNEAYIYNVIYPAPADYASASYPYYNDIIAGTPAATVGLFYAGLYPGAAIPDPMWDTGLHSYTPQYWNAASIHTYPISAQVSAQTTSQTLNGILAYGTADYINSYLVPLVGANTPIYITEFNCCSTPDGNPFLSYIYNGIFLAEYIVRMSSVPNVKGVGVNSLYTDNFDYHGMIQSVDDFVMYLNQQVEANPNYSTDTATNPNTQFQFYMSAPGLALEVANQAINNSTNIWPTTVTGGHSVPILGFNGQPIPAVYAQGYMGNNGNNYLLITNKGSNSQGVTVKVNGVKLSSTLNLTYVSSTNLSAANSATEQNNVQIQTSPVTTNPFSVGPYSVTLVTW